MFVVVMFVYLFVHGKIFSITLHLKKKDDNTVLLPCGSPTDMYNCCKVGQFPF